MSSGRIEILIRSLTDSKLSRWLTSIKTIFWWTRKLNSLSTANWSLNRVITCCNFWSLVIRIIWSQLRSFSYWYMKLKLSDEITILNKSESVTYFLKHCCVVCALHRVIETSGKIMAKRFLSFTTKRFFFLINHLKIHMKFQCLLHGAFEINVRRDSQSTCERKPPSSVKVKD